MESVKDTWDVLDSDYSLFIDGAAEFDEDLKPNNAGIGGLITVLFVLITYFLGYGFSFSLLPPRLSFHKIPDIS